MLNRIKELRTVAILSKDEELKNVTRMILGEVSRLNKKANQLPSDKEIIMIIWKLINNEREVLKFKNLPENEYIRILKSLIPEIIPVDDIKEFIKTIDMTKIKNPMAIIGIVKKHLGEEKIDTQDLFNIINK